MVDTGMWSALIDLLADFRGLSGSAQVSHSVVVLIVMLATGEVVWLAATQTRGRDRRLLMGEVVAAAVMGLGGLLLGLAFTLGFVAAYRTIGVFAPTSLVHLWSNRPVVAGVAAFVAWDAVGFVYHWVGHRTAVGWAAHRPHHTGTSFNLTLAWRQSWFPIHGLVLPVIALGGWPLSMIVASAAVSNLLQASQHTALAVRAPRWLGALVMTPDRHRHHHLRVTGHPTRTPAVNLGPVFTLWDRLAGSYVPGTVARGSEYGADGPGTSIIRSQADGWIRLVRGGPDPVSLHS